MNRITTKVETSLPAASILGLSVFDAHGIVSDRGRRLRRTKFQAEGPDILCKILSSNLFPKASSTAKQAKMGSLTTTGKFDFSGASLNTINGKLISMGKMRHGINPATGKPNSKILISTSQDVDNTVAAATEALKV